MILEADVIESEVLKTPVVLFKAVKALFLRTNNYINNVRDYLCGNFTS